MPKQIPIALAACIATLSAIGMPPAQAKQLCSAAMPSDPHGHSQAWAPTDSDSFEAQWRARLEKHF
jgi:hypothetical protein